MGDKSGMSSIAAVAASGPRREVYEYTVPEGAGIPFRGAALKSVGIVQLLLSEEEAAHNRVGVKVGNLAFALAKAAIREVNGQPVKVEDGSQDAAWSDMGPQGRSLVMEAYVDVHSTTDQVSKSFLASRKVKVG